MAKARVQPTGRESPFHDDELIVSKTDLKGRLIYANDVFLRVARYSAKEIFGQPHNIIRHPDMPRAVFKLLWDTIEKGSEIFAYVINMAANGDHYWVLAHVTPSFDRHGQPVGYHSNRRKAAPDKIAKIAPLYAALCEAERCASDRKVGLRNASQLLAQELADRGMEYDEFVLTL